MDKQRRGKRVAYTELIMFDFFLIYSELPLSSTNLKAVALLFVRELIYHNPKL